MEYRLFCSSMLYRRAYSKADTNVSVKHTFLYIYQASQTVSEKHSHLSLFGVRNRFGKMYLPTTNLHGVTKE
jgi:hypothetical protein